MNWQLIGWIKGDFQLDNPKRADDYVNLITPTAGGTCPLREITTFSYMVLKDVSQYTGPVRSVSCQYQQHHEWNQ